MSRLHLNPLRRVGELAVRIVKRPPRDPRAPRDPRQPRTDRVQISGFAQHMDRLRRLPPVRVNHVAQVRRDIATGTYETPDKLDKAIDGLLTDLD